MNPQTRGELITFLTGFGAGIVVIAWAWVLFSTLNIDLEIRAVKSEFAHYHPKTGDLVWDDEHVRYVIMGTEKGHQ